MNPKILILDEPTAGLDPQGRDDILDQIAALHKMRGITIILVSHSMEDIAKYVERLIVMNHGEMVFDDTRRMYFHYKELEGNGNLRHRRSPISCMRFSENGLNVDDCFVQASVRHAGTMEEIMEMKHRTGSGF